MKEDQDTPSWFQTGLAVVLNGLALIGVYIIMNFILFMAYDTLATAFSLPRLLFLNIVILFTAFITVMYMTGTIFAATIVTRIMNYVSYAYVEEEE
jgi:hypothetical protein